MTIGILGMALVLTCGGVGVLAQTEANKEKANESTPETAPKTYRLTYTITHSEGTKQLGVQHFSMTIIAKRRSANVRLGSRIPVATGPNPSQSGASAQGQSQIQYVDVGLNIDAGVQEYPIGVEVFSKVEQSSLADEPSGLGSSDPVIRQGTLQTTALLTLGKPVMLGSLDVPGSTRHMDIELVLELVK
jgi:hypothetical protein